MSDSGWDEDRGPSYPIVESVREVRRRGQQATVRGSPDPAVDRGKVMRPCHNLCPETLPQLVRRQLFDSKHDKENSWTGPSIGD